MMNFDWNRQWDIWRDQRNQIPDRACWFKVMIIFTKGVLLIPDSFSEKLPFLTLIYYHLNTFKWGVMKYWFSESAFNLLSNDIWYVYIHQKLRSSDFFTNILTLSYFSIPVLRTLSYRTHSEQKVKGPKWEIFKF